MQWHQFHSYSDIQFRMPSTCYCLASFRFGKIKEDIRTKALKVNYPLKVHGRLLIARHVTADLRSLLQWIINKIWNKLLINELWKRKMYLIYEHLAVTLQKISTEKRCICILYIFNVDHSCFDHYPKVTIISDIHTQICCNNCWIRAHKLAQDIVGKTNISAKQNFKLVLKFKSLIWLKSLYMILNHYPNISLYNRST